MNSDLQLSKQPNRRRFQKTAHHQVTDHQQAQGACAYPGLQAEQPTGDGLAGHTEKPREHSQQALGMLIPKSHVIIDILLIVD